MEIRQLAPFVFIVAAPYLGALIFGHEFDHQTMALRLLEPRGRMGLGLEKLALTFGIGLVFLTASWVMFRSIGVAESITLPLLWSLNSAAAGPALALATRSTLGAAALSFLGCLSSVGGARLATELREPPGRA